MTTRIGDLNAWINSHEVITADLTVEVEEIDVTPSMKIEPDMSWTYVDLRGHFHAFTHDGTLPTIKEVVIPHRVALDFDPSEDDEPITWDEWTEIIRKCAICDEVIEPRYREHMAVWRETAPGRKSWTLSVRWPEDILMPTLGEYVSVRIKAGDREYFGVGLATNRAPGYGADHPVRIASVEISGVGELGSRKVT